MVFEIVVRRTKRDGDINLQKCLADRISLLDKPKVHVCDARLGATVRRLERGMGDELSTRAGLGVGRLDHTSFVPSKSERKRRAEMRAARPTMARQSLANAIRATDVQMSRALRE